MRELDLEFSFLKRRVGAGLDLSEVDLSALNLIMKYGPLTPSALARRSGLHPATTTGILDRLERQEWITRERVPTDRRSVLIRFRSDRGAAMNRMFASMDARLQQVCDDYQSTELELITEFLRRAATACRSAADRLPAGRPGDG